jgi:hypothetical protein
MMPPIAFSRVLLPDPFGPIRPMVVPALTSSVTFLRAQKYYLFFDERPAFTMRSLRLFSLRMMNRFETFSTRTTGTALLMG